MENEAQRSQEKLKMREENIRQLQLLADDLISSDGYLMEENAMLRREIDLLKDQADINPQLNKFALENMRLLQQNKMYLFSPYLSTCFLSLGFNVVKLLMQPISCPNVKYHRLDNYYQYGERELLLAEISQLRNQVSIPILLNNAYQQIVNFSYLFNKCCYLSTIVVLLMSSFLACSCLLSSTASTRQNHRYASVLLSCKCSYYTRCFIPTKQGQKK
jgi:uncharacterized membrane protein YciS (DUF1049 family)